MLAQCHSYVFRAQSTEDKDRWVAEIQALIDQNEPEVENFHKIIELKKSALKQQSSCHWLEIP